MHYRETEFRSNVSYESPKSKLDNLITLTKDTLNSQGNKEIKDNGDNNEIKDKKEENKIKEKLLKDNVNSLMTSYTQGFVMAVNTGDYSKVEPYLESGSSIANLQRKAIKSFYNEGIKEENISTVIKGIEFDNANNTGIVETRENYNITYADGKKSNKTFNSKYRFTYNRENCKVLLRELIKV